MNCDRCAKDFQPNETVHLVTIEVGSFVAGDSVMGAAPGLEQILCDECGDELSSFIDGRPLAGAA
jgi:hypothetical protein